MIVNEMVERVAMALWLDSADCGVSGWSQKFPFQRNAEAYRRIARAAIQAMREPTEKMSDAAYEVKVPGADLDDFCVYDCAPAIWRAMVDDALTSR